MTTHKNYVYLSTLYSSHGNGYPVSPEKDKYIAVLPFFRESSVSIDVKKVADCDFYTPDIYGLLQYVAMFALNLLVKHNN